MKIAGISGLITRDAMRIAIRYTVVAGMFGGLLACTQPGDELIRHQPAAAPGADCVTGPDCAGAMPARETRPGEPATPPVPNSPLEVNCTTLPTQVERDTCINRKLSTG